MSYILDALRKSDQLRQRGVAPTLFVGQATAAAPRQPARIYFGMLALALLGAGIAIGWLRPWQPEPAVPPPVAIAANPSAADLGQLPAVAPDLQPKPEPQARNPALATQALVAATLAPASPPKAAGVAIAKQSAPPKAAAASSTQAAKPVPDQTPSAASVAAATTPVATVMAMAELPVAIQQELPTMSISVHAYSGKAAERLVGINSRLLHEGEFVAPGLRLEQITPDGMILSYKEYSFRRGVH